MIKRLQNGFKYGASTGNYSGALAVSASFLTGAACAVFYMHRCGTWFCTGILSASAYIIAAIILETIILGCSVIGSVILPVCAAVYGALVCICSAAVKQQGIAETEDIAVFLIMTPVFFLSAVEGLHFADCVRVSAPAGAAGSGIERYIVLACTALTITAAILRAAWLR